MLIIETEGLMMPAIITIRKMEIIPAEEMIMEMQGIIMGIHQ